MGKWQLWFMIGSGIYLILMGLVMLRKKDDRIRKTIGLYNSTIGIFSIIGAVVILAKPSGLDSIFKVYMIVMLSSFIIFSLLRFIGSRG
ncbi:hypothetical protein RBU49_14330 [Clostridium sp. MB40-C1]|uniref:hypothetical protein n=1 Tax=Clostridium sp. MB40-C1 TaxID=3070996 RepID=UPI0027DFDCAF|nr:hypothetical protein [Clostridium sp. MB40-C1]WMJ80018.1 hypothetical protein RBU49_14330 [Clostridium sp. MB40-C1]